MARTTRIEVRVTPDLKARLYAITGRRGASPAIEGLIRWYVGDPEAALPPRPAPQ